MKSWAINLLLALSVCSALALFSIKFKSESDTDRIVAALSRQHMVAGSRVVLKTYVPGYDELALAVTYGIIPAGLKPTYTGTDDTTLIIAPAGNADTTALTLLNHSSVIWQAQDDKFRYLLVHPK